MRVLILSLMIFCATYTSVNAQVACVALFDYKCSDLESTSTQYPCTNWICFDWDADAETPPTCYPPAIPFYEEEVPNGDVDGFYPALPGEAGISNPTVQDTVVCYRKSICIYECPENTCSADHVSTSRTYYTYTGTACVGN